MRALAVGNFDGVHKGHQQIIQTLQGEAGSRDLEVAALTFEPHPYRFFEPASEPFLITPKPLKERLLKQLGVGRVHFLRFDESLAAKSAEEFVKETLLDEFAAELVVVGEDFAFGKDRLGDAATVAELGKRHGFAVTIVKKVMLGDIPYSSTLARKHIRDGKMPQAAAILGRPFAINAPVTRGSGRGAALSFATANLDIDSQFYVRPKPGVYAATCGGSAAVANYGVRPTFGGGEPIMEVHVIGKTLPALKSLEVELHQHLRGEQKFADAAALRTQIATDITRSAAIVSSAK